ncbi:MAG: BrnT family toxin [Spirochaetia bacterium]
MDYIQFEWDKIKSETNAQKHNVSFEEAKTVFYDPDAMLIHDPDHSDDEDRFVIMSISQYLKLLVVCHCYRSNEEVIRIISARKANRDEIKQYGG